MTRHFLRYWIRHDGDWSVLEQRLMTYSASNQYGRVSIGDVIWAVVRHPDDNHLILVGRMTVDWIGNKLDASRRLQMAVEAMYDAEVYVTCDNPESYAHIDINDVVSDLRFVSKTNDRLDLIESLVSPQQLQTMRELAPQSAYLLGEFWYDSNFPAYPASVTQTFTEGLPKLQVHFQRERNQVLVSLAKSRFKEMHGRLFCEVCGFDFSEQYGALGEDFIEAHHRVPLSQSDDVVKNSVDDLAMVCANCHRMLHSKKPWLSVEKLKEELRSSIAPSAKNLTSA
jgi:hypothetical protein